MEYYRTKETTQDLFTKQITALLMLANYITINRN